MIHEPFTRAGSGSHAVLLIHGIAGSPVHFRDLVPVIPQSFSVYNILLEGHNGTVEDFAAASMKKWKVQVQATLEELFARHDQVVIVAHSMGTLFAVMAAINHPEKIPRLLLLAVPTRPRMRLQTLITCLRVSQGKLERPAALAMYQDTGITLTPQVWRYLGWLPRMAELLAECTRVRKQLPFLTVPTLTFQSRNDELVSVRSCRDLERIPCIQNTVLHASGHFAYGPSDTALLQTHLLDILTELEK